MAKQGDTVLIYTQGEVVNPSELTALFSLYQNQMNNPALNEGLHKDIFVGTQNCQFNVEVMSDGTAQLYVIPRTQGVDAFFTLPDGRTLRDRNGLTITLNQPWGICPCCDQLPNGKFEVWGYILFRPLTPRVA